MAANEYKKKSAKRKILFTILVLVVIAGAILAFALLSGKSTNGDYFTATIEQGQLRNVVSATGNVQAVLTVQVGCQVSGLIQTLYADYNSVVKRGQVLAKIDPRNYQAQVDNSKANLISAQASVSRAEADINNQLANLASAKANLESARVTRDNDAVTLRRYEDLIKTGIAAQSEYDNAKATSEGSASRYKQVAAQVDQVLAQINSSKASLNQAKAQVEQAQADLDRAKLNLEYTDIVSPVDGVVVSRSVDVGQTVQASLQAPQLFLIANDLTKMQVNANIDEADIGKISDQVEVRFTVDAYTNENFRGKIAEIRLNPQTTQNVVTYSVIISVDNPKLKLKPGMTANITITVDKRDNVLKVANAAMRYLPPGYTREMMAEEMRKLVTGEMDPSRETSTSTSSKPKDERRTQAQQQVVKTASTDQTKLAPETEQLLSQMQDPSLQPEDRRAIFQKMRALPDSEQTKLRERFAAMRERGKEETGKSSDQAKPAGGQWGGLGGSKTTESSKPTMGLGIAGLAPGQEWDPKKKIQFPEPPQTRSRPAITWTLGKDGKPEKHIIRLGLTDGVSTEIISGDLKEGDKVIIGDNTTPAATTTNQQSGQRSPFGGGPPMGRR